eukprot:751776-Hanusia_phi.AAC.5
MPEPAFLMIVPAVRLRRARGDGRARGEEGEKIQDGDANARTRLSEERRKQALRGGGGERSCGSVGNMGSSSKGGQHKGEKRETMGRDWREGERQSGRDEEEEHE